MDLLGDGLRDALLSYFLQNFLGGQDAVLVLVQHVEYLLGVLGLGEEADEFLDWRQV